MLTKNTSKLLKFFCVTAFISKLFSINAMMQEFKSFNYKISSLNNYFKKLTLEEIPESVYNSLKKELYNSKQNLNPIKSKRKVPNHLLKILANNPKFKETKTSFSTDSKNKNDLFWADTTNFEERLLLIVKAIDKLKQIFPDRLKKISIVSIGPGALLQEYLFVHALEIENFQNIDLHLIDPGKIENKVQVLKEQLNKDLSQKSIKLKISHWKTSYEFLQKKSKQPSYQTDLCFMISPSSHFSTFFEQPFKQDLMDTSKYNSIAPVVYFDVPGITKVPIVTTRIFIPYNQSNSFVRYHSTKLPIKFKEPENIIEALNKAIQNTKDLIKGINNAIKQNLLGKNIELGNQIFLSFFDVIRITGSKNCLAYSALKDKIKEYKNVKSTPYYELEMDFDEKTNLPSWTYNPKEKKFVKT